MTQRIINVEDSKVGLGAKKSPNKAKIEETLKKRVATATLFSFIMIMPQAARLASRLCI